MQAPPNPVGAVPPVQPQAHRAMNWKFQLQQYGFALVVAAPLYSALSIYLFYRRGYYDLYIVNKIFAGVAVILFGLVLLLGPASRSFPRFHKYVQYRKELGIVAFFLTIFHALASLFFLPTHFKQESYFTTGLWPFVFGLAATIILLIILAISNQIAIRSLGGKTWILIQSWGIRTTFVLVALHVGLMKMNDWIKWYQHGGDKVLKHPEWPGAGLLEGWFILLVLFVRIADMVDQRFGRAMLYVSCAALPLIYLVTFILGQRFLP